MKTTDKPKQIGNTMKLSKNLFLNLVAACLLTMPMFASTEIAAESEKQEMTSEAVQSSYASTKEENESTVQNGANYVTSHNRANHIYLGTTLYGDMIEIEDGSYWLTNPNDRLKLFDWFPGDVLLVLQNQSSFWSKPAYPYVILNTRNDQRIEVEINQAPLWDLRFFIIEIYKPVYGDGWLKLNDGSIWKLSSSNKDVWNLWEPNDTIIMGTNDSIFNFLTPNILLNVTCSQQFVTSRCTN